MTLRGEDSKDMEASLLLSDEERVKHFGLNGRATNLFFVECRDLSKNDDDLAEVARTSEPDILCKVYDIAENDDDVKGCVPELLWYKAAFEDVSTANICEHLGLDTQGNQVLYMIMFRKLKPITELVKKQFLHAWWATVKCHLALWKNGVYHRDISSSNLMYREDEGRVVGVLNDFDLASSTQETATGTERTSTVQFMAVQLLSKTALEDKIKHSYEHDAESFIWVLIWIVLRYANGNIKDDESRPLDEWLSEDAPGTGCRKEKNHFLCDVRMRRSLQAGEGHEENWKLAQICIIALRWRGIEYEVEGNKTLDIKTAFEKLLKDPTSHYL